MSDRPGPPPPPERITPYGSEPDDNVPPVRRSQAEWSAPAEPVQPDDPTPPAPLPPAPASPPPPAPAGYASPFSDDELRDPKSPGYVSPSRRGRDLSRPVLIGIGVVAAVAVVLIVAMVAGFLASSASNTEADDDPVFPTFTPAEPSAEPSPESTSTAGGANTTEFTYEGTGNERINVTLPDGGGELAIADITHRGERNFYVSAYDADDSLIGGVATGQGDYTGTVVLNALFDLETSSLDVLADGRWTITIRSIDTLETLPGPYSGTGDSVFRYEGTGGTAASTYEGESNFIVWSYGENKQLLENEIGAFTGTTEMQAGPAIIAVVARGEWTMTVT